MIDRTIVEAANEISGRFFGDFLNHGEAQSAIIKSILEKHFGGDVQVIAVEPGCKLSLYGACGSTEEALAKWNSGFQSGKLELKRVIVREIKE